jgi:AhpC/TSA family protein
MVNLETFVTGKLEIPSSVNYLGVTPISQLVKRRRTSLMPEVGDMAPDFELPSNLEKGKKVKLSDFRGKKNVVMAFYPLAWTPV